MEPQNRPRNIEEGEGNAPHVGLVYGHVPCGDIANTGRNRFVRWSGMGVSGRIFVELGEDGDTDEVMIPSWGIATRCPSRQWMPPT